MEYSTKVTQNLVPRFLEDMVELIIDKQYQSGEFPEVGGFEKVYEVPKLRTLKSEMKQTQKKMTIVGKGLD